MDIFKQKRYLVIVIIILIILNLSTIVMIWIGRPQESNKEIPYAQPRDIKIMLKKELNFSNEQTEKYLMLRDKHQEVTINLEKEIRNLKKQMFDKVLEDNNSSTISDSLLKLSLEKQSELEKLTFKHFVELKELCNSEQQKKLQLLIHVMFGPPKDRMNEGFQPPLPKGELPPPPIN
ncbi:MAG: hypothetical protein KKF62_06480 [Bacteroidetes bacterium]|nr:hypothetical protein [Bacteroidota bacterium]MBU1115431.1 hypothetical protein [Bacteroidota bacterium]MBU1797574.1 hypothetical protein [Bacteroidota bacterium]